MGYYKILSAPPAYCLPNYKGIYRSETCPISDKDEQNRFMFLWRRYIEYYNRNVGVTAELTISELMELRNLSCHYAIDDFYEVVYFSESYDCPYEAKYYGVDVAGARYSMLAEGIFQDSKEENCNLYDVINHHFRAKLNSNSLFDKFEDAQSFCTVLKDLLTLNPNCIENENWRVWHVFRVSEKIEQEDQK